MTPCPVCGQPSADGYVHNGETQALAAALTTAAGHAEDADAVIARQARYGTGGRASSDDPLPGDLTAAGKLHGIANAIGGWARVVTAETGRGPRWRAVAGPLCPPAGRRCDHDSCEAIRRRTPPPALACECAWLSTQAGWLRKHPAAAEAFRDLHAACTALARLVDRPPEKDLVGVCDCGKVLYAKSGDAYVTCTERTCGQCWHVERSRDILRAALDDKLVTAAQAAKLAQYLDTDRTQEQIRKLINAWAKRGQLVAHARFSDDEADAEDDGKTEPAYRFGDVAARLARTPRRPAA